MTVAFYNSRENGVDINSGRGYTRDEKIKPDYAAPGETVTGAVPGGDLRIGPVRAPQQRLQQADVP